jgi:hypothetical protein
MIRNESLLALLLFSMVGSIVLTTISVQVSFSSSAEETSDEGGEQQQDEPADEEPANDAPAPSDEPANDANPNLPEDGLTDEEQQQQEQLALDIISANGLVPVNETSPSGGGTIEREVTCVDAGQGRIFCYERLPTEENCLKPINVEDPPLCMPKSQ